MHPGLFVPPPRTSEWVLNYIRNAGGGDVPWINVVLLTHLQEKWGSLNATPRPVAPASPPLCLDYDAGGTEWSLDAAAPP